MRGRFTIFIKGGVGRAINGGRSPEGYTALVEQRSGAREADVLTIESEREYYADKASRVTIRHRLGRVVAFLEILLPYSFGLFLYLRRVRK